MLKNISYTDIENLLSESNKENIVAKVSEIHDLKILNMISQQYNWDNGFEIPFSIINNENCDIGTALLLFYNADGCRILENPNVLETSSLEQWKDFVCFVYQKIIKREFKTQELKFQPPLTKVQAFKLKKINANIDNIFLEGTRGVGD